MRERYRRRWQRLNETCQDSFVIPFSDSKTVTIDGSELVISTAWRIIDSYADSISSKVSEDISTRNDMVSISLDSRNIADRTMLCAAICRRFPRKPACHAYDPAVCDRRCSKTTPDRWARECVTRSAPNLRSWDFATTERIHDKNPIIISRGIAGKGIEIGKESFDGRIQDITTWWIFIGIQKPQERVTITDDNPSPDTMCSGVSSSVPDKFAPV